MGLVSIFLLVVCCAAGAVVFVLAAPRLGWRWALLFAPLVVGSGLAGLFGAFVAQFRLPPPVQPGWSTAVLVSLLALGALGNASLTAWVFLQVRRLLLARARSARQSAAFE